MVLFPVIFSLLMSLASQIPHVLAADTPRPRLSAPDETRNKQEAQRREVIAKKTAAESDALYQFMVAEDRVGIATTESTTPSPRPH